MVRVSGANAEIDRLHKVIDNDFDAQAGQRTVLRGLKEQVATVIYNLEHSTTEWDRPGKHWLPCFRGILERIEKAL